MRRCARKASGSPPSWLLAPRINQRIAGHERDFAWPDLRLAVEVDGHAVHAPRGGRVLRFTGAQLDGEPGRVAALRSAADGEPSLDHRMDR
jgi:hypothetical protein